MPQPQEAFAKQSQAVQQDKRARIRKLMMLEGHAIQGKLTKKNELLSASDRLVEAQKVEAV